MTQTISSNASNGIAQCEYALHDGSPQDLSISLNRAKVKRFVPPRKENAIHVHDEFNAQDENTNLIECIKWNRTRLVNFARLFAPAKTFCPAKKGTFDV